MNTTQPVPPSPIPLPVPVPSQFQLPVAEIGSQIAIALIAKTGVKEWTDPKIAQAVAVTARQMAETLLDIPAV